MKKLIAALMVLGFSVTAQAQNLVLQDGLIGNIPKDYNVLHEISHPIPKISNRLLNNSEIFPGYIHDVVAKDDYKIKETFYSNRQPNKICLDSFYQNRYPTIDVNVHEQALTQEGMEYVFTNNVMFICFPGYANASSFATKTGIWSAEYLSRERVLNGADDERTDDFYEAVVLPKNGRATKNDYRGSGYDRGHLAPARDMFDTVSMITSFCLCNIVPQHPENNRRVWSDIEAATRQKAMNSTSGIYVVTGTLYMDMHKKIGNSGVWVPTHMYKAVFEPASNKGVVYVSENNASQNYKMMSLTDFRLMSGWNIFGTDGKGVLSMPKLGSKK